MSTNDPALRARLEAALCEAVGADRVARMCPRCGSGEHGRPVVALVDTWVSLSYAGDAGVVAWSHAGPVGVDVERGEEHLDWTRREALLKATGQGIRGLADPLPDLPLARLPLPPPYVGHVAGPAPSWRLISGPGGPAAPSRAASR